LRIIKINQSLKIMISEKLTCKLNERSTAAKPSFSVIIIIIIILRIVILPNIFFTWATLIWLTVGLKIVRM